MPEDPRFSGGWVAALTGRRMGYGRYAEIVEGAEVLITTDSIDQSFECGVDYRVDGRQRWFHLDPVILLHSGTDAPYQVVLVVSVIWVGQRLSFMVICPIYYGDCIYQERTT